VLGHLASTTSLPQPRFHHLASVGAVVSLRDSFNYGVPSPSGRASATPVTAPAPSAAPSTGRVTRSVATRGRSRGGGVSGRGSSAAPARARGRRVAPTAAVRARNTRARGPRGSRSLNSNISAQARRNYSQFELGPSLEELDHQDTTRDCIEVDGDD